VPGHPSSLKRLLRRGSDVRGIGRRQLLEGSEVSEGGQRDLDLEECGNEGRHGRGGVFFVVVIERKHLQVE
jgi:hypothetical protein